MPEKTVVDVQCAAIRKRQHDIARDLFLATRNCLDRLVAQRLDLKLDEDVGKRLLGARRISFRQREAVLHPAIDQHAREGERGDADEPEHQAV